MQASEFGPVTWRAPGYSSGNHNRVEVATIPSSLFDWRKSRHSSGNDNCVEVGAAPGWRGVRDSKLGGAGPVLAFERAAFAAFLHGVKDGRFGR